jgi:4-hydroxythreonine-4-phosphate dehydrogenase
MLLVNERLRVVHVSTHVPLRRACEPDPQRILRTIELGRDAMRLLGVAEPRIAVCGLNPHAGENGLFGDEDARLIAPAVAWALERGIRCEGPVAADTVFLKAVRGGYDLVVAMYHDQGHIPMKLLDFEHTVNVTLGLPIIRTSVDHGTAFDIAGKNLADPSSMKAALKLAVLMAGHRRAGETARST